MHLQPGFSFGKLDEGRCPPKLPIAFAVGVDVFVDQNTLVLLPCNLPINSHTPGLLQRYNHATC